RTPLWFPQWARETNIVKIVACCIYIFVTYIFGDSPYQGVNGFRGKPNNYSLKRVRTAYTSSQLVELEAFHLNCFLCHPRSSYHPWLKLQQKYYVSASVYSNSMKAQQKYGNTTPEYAPCSMQDNDSIFFIMLKMIHCDPNTSYLLGHNSSQERIKHALKLTHL
uniref:Uncharacterized protein n=1 Tax=Hucho hucho TaxID=62062 RepID=A0A4W5JQY7_9TELE